MSDLRGQKLAEQIQDNLRHKIDLLVQKGIRPTIAPILVGDDPGARIYFRTKRKLAKDLGINFEGLELSSDVSQEDLQGKIGELNSDNRIHGLFVELPLPDHLSFEEVKRSIDPQKDIDSIHPYTSGQLVSGGATSRSYDQLKNDPQVLLPATPYAVMELLAHKDIKLEEKSIVVVGAGAVGLPLALLLLRAGYSSVDICEYNCSDLSAHTNRADVLCVAVGRRNFITPKMVSSGAVVVDVGINSTESGITGDVDYEAVKNKAELITPVPGGVGPVTTSLIMKNTVQVAEAISQQ